MASSMGNLSTYSRQQDEGDVAIDPGSKNFKCKSDEKHKTDQLLAYSDFNFTVGNSDEPAILKTKKNDDSQTYVASIKKKFISAVEDENKEENEDENEDENKDIVKSLFDELFDPSDILLKSWNSDSYPEEEDVKFEIWRDTANIVMKKDTKHSEEIPKLLSDENYSAVTSFRDSDLDLAVGNSNEIALTKTIENGNSETDVTLFKKKFISAVKDDNEDIVESLLDEIFDTSDVFVKSWSSDSHSEKQENIFEVWIDAIYIAIVKDTKHSQEIMKLLLDDDIIWSLETKMNDLLLRRIIHNENIVDDYKYHRLIRPKIEVDDRHLRLIEMLLKSGKINVNARDKKGRTALHSAQEEKLTTLLISYGADVNEKDNEGKTPLMHMWGVKVSVLQTLLNEARTLVDLDAIDCNGRTALMIAAIGALPDVAELLLNAGASVNLSDHLGFTALHYALFTRFDHYDQFPRTLEELKKRKEIFTILFDAKDEEIRKEFEKGKLQRMKIVEMLLRRPEIDANALSFEQFSPLDMAEIRIPEIPSSIENYLKEKGAVLNVFRQQETLSASDFHLDVRSRLALQRLFLFVRDLDPDGEILPVHEFEKRLLTLIEAFQNQIVPDKDHQGRTALHLVAISFSIMWAVYHWKLGITKGLDYETYFANTIVKKLITIGCSVNETDIYGRTPLHYANFILKDSLISHGADASIKDKDGYSAMDEKPNESSIKYSDIVETVIERNDETYFLRLMNNMQMEIEFQVKAYDDGVVWLETVPRLLWETGEYAIQHPLVKQITNEVIDLMDAIVSEIERLDPRFEIRTVPVGSSNEGTRLDGPNEFDFCFVLIKISELCKVYQSPELPTGFVRLKRKSVRVDETSDFDSFFGEDGILNTEKLNWQFTMILHNAVVNIESQQSLDCNLEMPIRRIIGSPMKKTSNIVMMKSLNLTTVDYISIDIVPCIHVDGWWPDEGISNVSDEIKKFGCNLVFDRPQKLSPWVPYSESCARISFSKAESDMVKQSCNNAREAYMIGKMVTEYTPCQCGYVLKNCLLYCLEALTPTSEKASQLGLSLEELESKFYQIDRYLWLKCLLKCHLEFVSQDFCPSYFLPNFNSPIGDNYLKEYSLDWMTRDADRFPKSCKNAHLFYRCTSSAILESCCQLPAPDPLWERFDRNQSVGNLCEIAYNNLKL